MSTDLIRRLIEAGTPADLVAEVAMALGTAEAERKALAERRAADVVRKQKQRARDAVSRDVTGRHSESQAVPPSSPPKDPTPQNTPPIIPPHSDADASDDADAPASAELPVVDQIWLKVPDLSDLAGRKQETVRAWIGKALKDYPPETVLAGISSALRAKSGDPFAYAKRVMMGSTDPPRRPPADERPKSVQQAARDFVEEVRQREEAQAQQVRGMNFDDVRILTLPAFGRG